MSGEWLVVELFGVGVALALHMLVSARARRKGSDVWKAIAERRELLQSSTGLMSSFTGRIDGLLVEVRMGQLETGAGQHVGTRVEVTGPISPAIGIEPEGLDFGELFRPERAHTGNLEEARAAATLDAATRRLASQLAKKLRASVTGGTVSFAAEHLRSQTAAEQALEEVLKLARILSLPPTEVPARLLKNVQHEPLPEARLHSHKLLLLCYPKSPEGLRALELARTAGDPELTLLRAALLPDRPFETAQKLALGRELRTHVRLKALALATEQDDARLPALLAALIVDPDAALGRAATRLVRREHAQAVLAALVARADQVDAAGARELLHALLELSEPAAEPALLTLLARHELALRSELVDALGKLGGLRAVEPLLALEAAGHPEAREAITAIQSRLGDAEAGRLSVVQGSDAEGALSLAGPGEGALTLHDDERER